MARVETYATHIFSYRFEGKSYTVDIVAKDADEAKERLKALAWAQYDGELIARFPSNAGPLVRIAVWLRNYLHTTSKSGA